MTASLPCATWAVLPCSVSTSATREAVYDLHVFQNHVRAALFSASPATPDLFAHCCGQELLMSTGLLQAWVSTSYAGVQSLDTNQLQ